MRQTIHRVLRLLSQLPIRPPLPCRLKTPRAIGQIIFQGWANCDGLSITTAIQPRRVSSSPWQRTHRNRFIRRPPAGDQQLSIFVIGFSAVEHAAWQHDGVVNRAPRLALAEVSWLPQNSFVLRACRDSSLPLCYCLSDTISIRGTCGLQRVPSGLVSSTCSKRQFYQKARRLPCKSYRSYFSSNSVV